MGRLSPAEGPRLQRIVRHGESKRGGNVVCWRRATILLASAGGNTVPLKRRAGGRGRGHRAASGSPVQRDRARLPGPRVGGRPSPTVQYRSGKPRGPQRPSPGPRSSGNPTPAGRCASSAPICARMRPWGLCRAPRPARSAAPAWDQLSAHRHLESIRAAGPDGHKIITRPDNLSAHTGQQIRRWARNHCVALCFTPALASWANRSRRISARCGSSPW